MTKGIRNYETARPTLGGLVPLKRLLEDVHVTMPDRAYVTAEYDGAAWKAVRVLTDTIGGRANLSGCSALSSFRPLKEALSSLLPLEERVRFRARVELRRSDRGRWYFRDPNVVNEGIPLHREIANV
ncbi:hypothetical protein [Mesorhizobium sp. A623]